MEQVDWQEPLGLPTFGPALIQTQVNKPQCTGVRGSTRQSYVQPGLAL